MKRQRRLRGGRPRLTASVSQRVRRAVEREAARYGVSLSWVENVNLARALGVELEEEDVYSWPLRARRRKVA